MKTMEADNFFAELAEIKPSASAGICVYKGRINEKLQERRAGAYRDILGFLGEEAYAKAAQYDEDLTRFAVTGAIYRMEEGSVGRTIYDCIEYTDDFLEIWSEVRFLFLRILLGMTHEDCLAYIEKKGISVFVLQQILQEMPFERKEKIVISLAAYYRSMGRDKEADYLRMVTEAGYEGK